MKNAVLIAALVVVILAIGARMHRRTMASLLALSGVAVAALVVTRKSA